MNLKEINAFALPGGPMFVNRGMFDAAAAEGEVVGVMAHELSHVLLRHGTANASKAQNPWLQLGQIAGVVGGAVVGGAAGSAIAQGSQFGLGTLLLRYSRDFEKQADLLGAQIMARAGYDPRALARMFETIERESKSSGGGSPQWMSSHPNPGNRTQYITKEAQLLTIASAADETRVRADQDGVRVAAAGRSRWPISPREGAVRRRSASIGRNARPACPAAIVAVSRASAVARCFRRPFHPTGPACRRTARSRSFRRTVRPTQRTDGVQPRRRVRRHEGGIAGSAGSDERLAEGRRAEQSRSPSRRGAAVDADFPALGDSARRSSTRRRSAAGNASALYTTFLADGSCSTT